MASTLAELLAQKAALEQSIAAMQTEHRAETISKVRQLMAENGLTLADLTGRAGTGAPKSVKSLSGSKVAAKYRDATSGNSWSGRGLKPRWLSEALAAGKTIEEFAV